MGTRGYIGIRYKGKTYYFYNHWDSYPDGLGAAIVRELLKILKMRGGVESFCQDVLSKVFFVNSEEEVPKAIDLLKTSGVTFSSACLKENPFPGLFEVKRIVGLSSETTASPEFLYKELEKITLYHNGKSWVKTRDDLATLTSSGGFVQWTVSSPKGPLDRFLRLGVAVPTLVIEGEDKEDHRDLFIEWTYVVDFDAQTFGTSGVGTLPFDCLVSEKAYLAFVDANPENY